MILLILFLGWFCHAEEGNYKFTLETAHTENHLLQHVDVETVQLDEKMRVKVLRLPQPLRETLQTIANKYGGVACDCGLFAQISAILNREDQLNPSTLLFPGDNRAEWIACACDHDFAYMHLTNESHHLALQNSSYINKGQWLVPLGNARFKGLRSAGPSTEPMGQWIKKAESGLLKEHEEKQKCLEDLDPASAELFEIRYVDAIHNMGETKRWKITPIRRADIPAKQRAALRKLLED